MSSESNVSPRQRNQVVITLSDKALEEYGLVADWKGQPLASLLREVLEQHHSSPSFGNVVKRAKLDSEQAIEAEE